MTRQKISNKKRVRTLAHLLSDDDIRNFNLALNKEPDFPCVLILTNYLDEGLAALLSARFADADEGEKLLNWKLNGPLSSLNARILTAYCIGLISETTFRHLDTIRAIRNLFGHPQQSVDFTSESISKLCGDLPPVPMADEAFEKSGLQEYGFDKDVVDTPRRRFAHAAVTESSKSKDT